MKLISCASLLAASLVAAGTGHAQDADLIVNYALIATQYQVVPEAEALA